MRRRRIRSAKRKQGSGGWNILIFLLLVAVVAVYAWLALHRGDLTNAPTQPVSSVIKAASTLPDASPSPGKSVDPADTVAAAGKSTETITLKSVTLYAVQLGVFSDEANATTAANEFKAKGAAGYILKDGSLYRVLDSVYYQQNDAKTARDAFKAQQADAACLFNVQTAGIQWNVSGSRAQIDAIKAAVNTFQTEIVKLINVQRQASQGGANADDAVAAVRAAANDFTAANDALTKAVGQTKQPVIQALSQCLTDSAANLNKLADGGASNIVDFLSNLKYNVIDILLMLENKIMKTE